MAGTVSMPWNTARLRWWVLTAPAACSPGPVSFIRTNALPIVSLVLSSLAFHYVADFPALVGRISQWLRPGGSFVFSVEHPVFTSYGTQDWWYGPDGTILHFPVDRYFEEGPREAVFLGETMTKYHRTLTTYLQTLLEQGLVLRQVVEPRPPQEMMDLPGMREELRRPMMLLVGAEKPGEASI